MQISPDITLVPCMYIFKSFCVSAVGVVVLAVLRLLLFQSPLGPLFSVFSFANIRLLGIRCNCCKFFITNLPQGSRRGTLDCICMFLHTL